MIKRGAPDLKQKLQDAQTAEEAMAVLWTAASAEAACAPAVQALQSMTSTSSGGPQLLESLTLCFRPQVCGACLETIECPHR